MLVDSWEQGTQLVAQQQQQLSDGSSAVHECQGLTAHLFTPSLTRAQQMVESSSSSDVGTSTSSSRDSDGDSSPDVGTSNSASSRSAEDSGEVRDREALERIFAIDGSSRGGASNSTDSPQSTGSASSSIQVHLAEWAVASQPARAKALGLDGIALTDEMEFAELCGCAGSRAVLDGVNWG